MRKLLPILLFLLPLPALAQTTTIGGLTPRGTLEATDVYECEDTTPAGSYKCTLSEIKDLILTYINSETELEALVADMTNILQASEIDTEAKLVALMSDVSSILEDEDLNSEAELESLLADVTQVLTSSDSGTSLPGAPSTGDLFIVTDDPSAGACTSAGGSSISLCRYNGATWDSVGAGDVGTDAVGTSQLDDDANTPIAGDVVIVEAGASSFDYLTPNIGTDISADLEEEAHASEHDGAGIETSGEQLAVDLIDDGDAQSASTFSESGLEFVSGELGLIRGCNDGELLQWDNINGDWYCDTDDGAAPGTDSIGVDELDDATTPIVGDLVIVNTGGANFDYLTPNANTDITADLEEEAHASEHDGTGIEISGETVNVDVVDDGDGETSTTFSESGLEFLSGELSLLRGCTDNDTLTWDEAAKDWNCQSVTNEWTDLGGVIHPAENADDVVMGATAAVGGAKVSIDGDENEVQLAVEAFAAQTANVVLVQDSGGANELMTLDIDGNLEISGDITTAPSTIPTIEFHDVDMGGTPDVNAKIEVNCPGGSTATNDEDCDMILGVQGNGAMTEIFKIYTNPTGGATDIQMGNPGTAYVSVDESGAMTFSSGDIDLPDESVDESDLNSADGPGDEECLTWETDSSQFQWETCGGGGSEWADTGDNVYPNELADEVIVGSATPINSSKFSVLNNDADQIGLTVRGYSGQSSDIAVFEKSDGTDLWSIDVSGNMVVGGSGSLIQGGGSTDLDIDANGQNITLGDGGTTNYVQVSDGGRMTFAGTGTVAIPSGSAFPGSPSTGDIFRITTAASVGECNTSGSSTTLCYYTGAAWASLGDGNTGAAPDIDSVTGQGSWDTAATKKTADLTIEGVEVDFENGASEGFPLLAQSATPPSAECDAAAEYGRLYFDTDQDTDGSVMVCTSSGWKDVDDDGGAGGFSNFDITDTDTSPILTVDDGEQIQFIGSGTVTVTAAADGSDHDVTIAGSAHFSPTAGISTDHGAGAVAALSDIGDLCAGDQYLARNTGDSAWECVNESGASANSFETWDTPSGTDPVADSSTDTIQFVAANNMTITGANDPETVTFGWTGAFADAQVDGSLEENEISHDGLNDFAAGEHYPQRQAASDCTAETGGVTNETCWEADDNTWYVCESGPCNGSGWVAATAAGDGTGYNTVEDNDTPMTQRGTLNLISGGTVTVSCADDAGNTETDCTFTGSAHTATAITDGLIVEADLDEDSGTPTDEDVLTYDSTGANFNWVAQANLSVGSATSATTATTANNLAADGVDAISEIDAAIKRGPDATDTHILTTDESAPGSPECLQMDTDGSVTLSGGACGAGSFTSFDIDGDNNSPQTITDGEEALIAGGEGISTVASSGPEKVTIGHDYSYTIAANPTLGAERAVFSTDGFGGIIYEGDSSDTAEFLWEFPAYDDSGGDVTDQLVAEDTTQTLTNKTIAAANNAVEADDLICSDCIDDTEVSTNAGTALSADLEEESYIGLTQVTGNAADDQVLLGTGSNAAGWTSLADCTGENHLRYDASANTFSCDDDDTGAAAYSFNLDGDNDSPQTISNGEEALIAGGSGVTTTASATPEKVTIDLDTSEASSIASGTAAPANDGALVIDTDGDNTNIINDVLSFQSGAEDFVIPVVREYPTNNGEVLRFNSTNDDWEWDYAAQGNASGEATSVATGVCGTGATYNSGACDVDLGTTVGESELAAEDYGDFSCGAGADDCLIDSDALTSADINEGGAAWDFSSTTTTFAANDIASSEIATEVRSIYWPAGSFSSDGTNCADPAEATPVTGAFKTYVVVCGDGGTFYGQAVLPDGLDDTADINFELTATDGTGSVTLAGDFGYQCWSSDEAITSSWQTGAANDVTLTTADDLYQGTTAGIDIETPCAAGDFFAWRYVIDDANHDATSAEILGVKMEYTTNVGD